MIKGYNIAELKDKNKKHKVSFEVNKKGINRKSVILHFDDQEAYIDIKDLYSVVFMMADAEAQLEMMPVSKTTVTTYKRAIKIIATKDIKKGETICANIEYSLPTTINEGLAGLLSKKQIKEIRKGEKS
jgi:hypothetical protein